MYPDDEQAIFPQNEPEPILDVRVQKNPQAALRYQELREQNKLKKRSTQQEYVKSAEEIQEEELIRGFRGLDVADDDSRAEERDDEDINELVNAMGRLQIHNKVKASRCSLQ